MVHLDHDDSVVAKWQPEVFFDVTHGGFYEPLPPLVFEVKNEKDQKNRIYRLYTDGVPATGGQWHYDLESAFERAEYVSANYIFNRKGRIENQYRMVRHK